MRPEHFLLIPLALGHVALFVLVVNVLHALGHAEKTLDRAKLALVSAFGLLSAGLAWSVARGPLASWSWPVWVYSLICLVAGLFLFPASTAWLHLRPRPKGVTERAEEIDLAAALGRDALVGGGKHAWLLRLPKNESLRLRKVDAEVKLPGLPAALDGLTLLHLSDLHFAHSFKRAFFEAVVAEAASLPSDVVAFTGDLLDDDGAAEWVVPVLSPLKGRYGSYSILGNHDFGHHPDELRTLLEAAGFTDLEARWTTVEVNGQTIALGGTSYPWGPPLPVSERPRADYRILLSHLPDLFYRAERGGFDLMLSGHNHGGQIRLPLVGSVVMPSLYSRRFDRGYFRRGGLTIHVSQGVAGRHPFRFGGCVPEVTRLTLRAVAPTQPTTRVHTEELSLDQVS